MHASAADRSCAVLGVKPLLKREYKALKVCYGRRLGCYSGVGRTSRLAMQGEVDGKEASRETTCFYFKKFILYTNNHAFP